MSGSAAEAAAALPKLAALDTASLSATEEVTLAVGEPDITYDLRLAGPGNKYSWTINEKTYNPAEGLPVREGQRCGCASSTTP